VQTTNLNGFSTSLSIWFRLGAFSGSIFIFSTEHSRMIFPTLFYGTARNRRWVWLSFLALWLLA